MQIKTKHHRPFIKIFSLLLTVSTFVLPIAHADDFVPIDEGDAITSISSNTFVLDDDNTATNEIILQFGETLNKNLEFDILNNLFELNDSLSIQGDLNLSGTVDGVDISSLASDVNNHNTSTSNPHQTTLEQARSQSNQLSGDIDFNQNQALELTLQNAISAPASPAKGQTYFNTTINKAYIWDGTAWLDMVNTGSGSTWVEVGTGATGTNSNFFMIDNDDDGNPQILSFGSSFGKTLTFDVSSDWFNLSDRLNIGGDGSIDGIKLTTRASASDSEQNQIEVRNNANSTVFGVDEDGDITLSGTVDGVDVSNLNSTVTNLDTDLTTLEGNVTTLQTNLNTHTADTSNPHQTTLEQARQQNNHLGGDITSDGNISLSGTVDGVDVSDLATNVNNHQADSNNPHNTTLEQVRTNGNQLSGDIYSSGSIVLDGNVDGVDISDFKTEFDTHSGSNINPHQVSLEQARTQDNTFQGPVDFNNHVAENFVLESLSTAPTSPTDGQSYYNTSSGKAYIWVGSEWNELNTVHNVIFVYDSTGWQEVTQTPIVLNLDTAVLIDSYYSLNNDEITMQKDALYKIDVNVALEVINQFGQLRSDFEVRVQEDRGTGFVDIPYGVGAGNYIRETVDRTSARTSFIRHFNAGTKVRIQVVQVSYDTNIQTLMNASNITIEYVR